MSGLGAGTVGSVVFSDVEHLIGADDNEDEFTFSASGSLAGSVEGGARGYDTVVLDGSFQSVVFTASNSSDGTIARDSDVLTYKGFEPLVVTGTSENYTFDASGVADEIKVSRPAAGKILIESTNTLFGLPSPTFESVELLDPTASLTIKTGANVIGPLGADSVTVEALGVFGADLTIDTGGLSRMVDGEDTITFKGDIDLQGKKLQATAENITVNSGVTLKTSDTTATAGSITLSSWHTTIQTNAKLLAEGKDATSYGDITIEANDVHAIFTPAVNIEIKDVGVDVQAGAEIKGDDVKIVAQTDTSHIFGGDNFSLTDTSTWGDAAADKALSKLEGLTTVVAAVSVVKTEATIDVATGASIVAKGDFTAHAESKVKSTAAPKFTSKIGEKIGVPLPALAIAVGLSDARVTIGGSIEVGDDATISAKGDHTLDANSDASEVKRVAAAGALTVLDSDIKAHLTDDAVVNVGGDLFVTAQTIDRNRTAAASNAGKEGDIAISAAVSIEDGRTSAFLDSAATVGGSVTVSAKQSKEQVPTNVLLFVPTMSSGTLAAAGVGSDDGGDLLDGAQDALMGSAKGGLTTFGTWVKEKWSGKDSKTSKDLQKDDTVTKDNAFSFDAAAAVSVAIDTNTTTARIGDGGSDAGGADAMYGVVTAGGDVSVLSQVSSRPDITATSTILSDAKASGGDTTKFAGSLALAVGVYNNEAYARISEQAQVTSDANLTVDAKALNEIDPAGIFGVNLVTPFLKKADFDTTQGTQNVETDQIVEIKEGHNAGGDSGTWYKFQGADQDIDLSNEDFTNELRWKSLGNPIKHIVVDNFVPNLASYLNDNLGLNDNLIDTWSQATAKGDAKTGIAGAITVVDLNHKAEAVIKSGAKINEGVTGNGDRTVNVTASSTSMLVNLGGNIQLPGINTSGEKISEFKVSFQKPGLGTGAKENAAGATVMVFDLDNTVEARIEDGAKITGDNLKVTADNFAVDVSVGASGGDSDNFGLNGAFLVTLLDNTTLAQIDNGAMLTIGAKAVQDKYGDGGAAILDANGNTASLLVTAQDKTYVAHLTGGIVMSEHIGVGMSAAVTIVNRDTEAVIGNRHDSTEVGTRGSVTSTGNVRLDARNEGFVGSIVVAGSKASQSSQTDTPPAGGSTGLNGANSKSTDDDPGKLPNNQKSYDSVIAELKAKFGETEPPAEDEKVSKQQGKAGIAVSGAASVTVVDDNARAYLREVGVVTATNQALLLSAANNTHVGSLAGAVSFAGDAKSASSDAAIAGAFGGNFISGTTQSFLSDATSVSSKTLTVEADRDGWIVSLTAGVSGAQGKKGVAVGGSVGVTMTDYTTEAMLSKTTGTIDGALTVAADDSTNIILIAGSAGFGGKAGVGAAIGFTQISNDTLASIDTVTNLRHAGALSVTANSSALIVAVTGSVGAGTGANSTAGLAGTLTINRVANTVEAEIRNSLFDAASSGNIAVRATDNSFIFSFAGAFGTANQAAIGVAAAVNLLDNTVRSHVESSTLRSTAGTLDIEAEQTGTLVSVAVGVAAGKQFAGAGSITVNDIDNTIEAIVDKGADVKVSGAIDIHAEDTSVSVTVSGGVAVSTQSVAAGAAFAGNFISNTLTAKVDDSVVESTGSSAGLGAEARSTLVTIAIGAAASTNSFALGGSVAVNEVSNTIETSVTDSNGGMTGRDSLFKAKNDVSIAAADATTMVVVAGGLAFAQSAAVGITASTTQVLNKVHAYVNNADVTSTHGKVSVAAGFKPPDADADLQAISYGTTGIVRPESDERMGSQIVNIAVGVAGSAGSFGGGAAISLNWIRNDVQAYAASGATVSAAGDITFAASDDPEIDSFAIGGGFSGGSGGVGVGFSYNYIGGDPGNPSRDFESYDPEHPTQHGKASANIGKALASVDASTLTSSGGTVSILAGSTPKIINATIAGGGGSTAGVSGAVSINFIRSLVESTVTGGSSITANNSVKVGASAVPIMITIAGNVAVGGTAGVGAAVGVNDMQSKITAKVDGSMVKATTGDIIVDASIGKAAVLPPLDTDVAVDAQIWSFAVSGSGAGTAAIAGSGSLNWIRNTVEATISNVGNIDVSADEISAGGKVSVTASDASTLNAIAGGFAVAPVPGSVGIGASVAYNFLGGSPENSNNEDNNSVKASIQNITGQLKAASIDVKSSYTGSINNITIGGSVAGTLSAGGALSINNIRNTADAHISGSTGISTTSGNITIESKDTSTIRALAGGIGVAVSGGLAAAIGVSAGVNEIRNTTKAYIDNSSVTAATGLSLTADAKQTIEVLTVGGAVAVAGEGVGIAAAGAGSGNTVDNDVLAYITNSGGSKEIKANSGSIALTAKDESTIRAASGGIAVAVAAGGGGGVGASVGVSASENDITNTIKAYIDASKVTATSGNVDLQASEKATIEALAIAGSASVAGGLIGGGAFAGAGAGAGNTIANTVQAYVSGKSTVSTVTSGMVKLSATDASKIKIDSGGVAVAAAGGAGGGLAAAAGASVAVNKITNTIQAYADDSTITSAGAVQISATSTPTIDALSISGSVAASGGAGGGISAAGSGSSSDNTIANKVDAFALKSTVTSNNGGAVSITATETAKITAESVGAAVAVAVGGVGGAASVGVGLADNEVKSTIKAYSDQSTITSAGAIDLKASSSSTTTSLSIAVAVSVSGAPAGLAVSGGGANSTSLVENTVQAYAVGTAAKKSDITAADPITISATETSKLTAEVGSGAVSVGLLGASIGVSIANNTAKSHVKAYADHVNLTSTGVDVDKDGVALDGIKILASADDTIDKTLGVATSVAISIGGAGAGAESTATVTPNVEAYIGGGAVLQAGGDVALSAKSKASVDAETYGIAVGMVAVGGSVATATAGGNIAAHVDGVIQSSKNVSVMADASQKASGRATALAGGIISGAGAAGTAKVTPTVKAYGAGNITASDTVSFAATATPEAFGSALGISAGALAVGVSDATALASPNLEARPGGAATTITARVLNVASSMKVPLGSYTARTQATGATGGLISVNATESTATTSGKVYSSVAGGSTLVISDAISITAVGDSKQKADADSFNVGLVAEGGNEASAVASVDTRAFLEAEVNVSNGTDIGNLTDGGKYYIILDDLRSFTAGAVNTSNSGTTANSIDLGGDHGLKNGDRVVFREQGSPLGGLVTLNTYEVRLVAGTNRVQLLLVDAETGNVATTATDLTSAAAGQLILQDPRRVRLSATSEGALKSPTQIIDLTAAGTGAKHSLTPLTGFAAGAFEFNPALNVNLAANTIELASGHKLQSGQAVTYARAGGAALTISATGNDYSHAISEAGSGGVVAGQAAQANTTGTSGTRAYIADDTDLDGTKTSLRVSKLNIVADHTSRYDSELSTIQASVVGNSGAWASNSQKTTVEATIGKSADIITQNLEVVATNRTKKDIVGDNNVKSGSGGVFQGNNAESVTIVENRTHATIGDGASVKVTGSMFAPGNFLLSALNDHTGNDEVLLDTGGVFAGSGVTSHIRVNVNEAVAAIGKGATIETVGALDLQTRATAELGTHATAHTYGLAGGAGVDSEVVIHTNNSVSIGEATKVQALGDINLLAGRDRTGARNVFKLRSEGDDLNATAVPISSMRSEINITQNHAVNVAKDAVVKGARDANLMAENIGTAELTAFGSGKNWMTAIAGGIDSLLGGGMSEEEKGGKATNVKTVTVNVDGLVEVGILKDQKLTISRGDASSESSLIKVGDPSDVGTITATTTIESLANNLAQERRRLQNLISEYFGDAVTVAAYTAALEQVEAQMISMGLSTTSPDGSTGFIEEYNVPYVTIDPIWAQSGTIRINTNSVTGEGDLIAPGNVKVSIINTSPAFLRIRGITIPDTAGGVVLLNGQQLTEDKKGETGFTGSIVSSKDGGLPQIEIKSTYDSSFPQNQVFPWNLFKTPDVEIVGDIENVVGKVTIESAGSIISRANIIAGELKITAGKDFVLTSNESLFNAGGNPAGQAGPWNLPLGQVSVQSEAEAFGAANGGVGDPVHISVTGGTVTHSEGAPAGFASKVAAAVAAGTKGSIVAANNVIIVAQSINANGVLQSGISDYQVHIDSTYQNKIDAAEKARDQYLSGDVWGARFTALINGLEADEGYTFFKVAGPVLVTDDGGLTYSPAAGGNNIPVFYNAALDRLEASAVQVQGGFMSLTGRILNTNSQAEIKVMDGYGRINITNDLDIPLVVNKLDTSSGIEGKLKITDTGDLNATGAPLVTEYTRVGANIKKEQYYFVTPGTAPTVVNTEFKNGAREWEYTPESTGYRFFWTTGNDLTKKTVTTYGTSAWLGIDALAADPGTVREGPTVTYANLRALATGDYVQAGSSADYTYDFRRINLAAPVKETVRWETSTWYGTTTYYTKVTESQGQKDIHTHSIRADRNIKVHFIGYDEGAAQVNVTTAGELLVNGSVLNSAGSTSLKANGGSISLINDSATVGGRSISLTADDSIGADVTMRTNLTDGQGGSLSAVASEVVRIQEITGDLVVNQVRVDIDGDRVELKANGKILGVAGNLVQGGLIVIESGADVGSLGSGTARLPGGDAQAININTGNTDRDTLTVKARGNVFLHETAGDLRLVSIDTTDSSGNVVGDVRVSVAAGRLIDANTLQVKDPRTELQLMGIWNRMNATESTAYVSTEATVRSYEQLRTREYQTYWDYRHSQPDHGAVFDGTFQVTLSDAERAAYIAYFAAQGQSPADIDLAIETIENGRTQEYIDLHKTYGRFGDVFDDTFRYSTAATQTFGATAVDFLADSITLKGHAFDTGDAVVYHSGGGTIDGLVDGQTYYVVAGVDGKFTLAESREEALKATPTIVGLSNSGAGGDQHVFSALDLTFGAGAIDVDNNTINLPRHTFRTGESVVFQSTGAGAVGGLTDGSTYYVIADETGAIQLATSSPTVIDLGAATDATAIFKLNGVAFSESNLDGKGNTIELAGHTFTTGQAVVFESDKGTIAGLVSGQTYYVVVDSATNKISLAKTLAEAVTAPEIVDLSAVSGAGTTFVLSEADVLTQKAAWSEKQLKNSFSSKILGPKGASGTTATIEDANIIANDIAVKVSSDIGSIEDEIVIDLPLVGELSDAQKMALASADRSDVTFYGADGGEITNPRDSSVTVTKIVVVPKADFDITVKGILTVDGGKTVNVGSEESMNIDQVKSAEGARIMGQKALTSAETSVVNVISGGLIMEAEDEHIGTAAAPLVIDLNSGTATLVARAKNDIFISEHDGDLSIVEVTSTDGNVTLRSDESILDADNDDLSLSDWNIMARTLTLEAGTGGDVRGAIGTASNYLEVEVANGFKVHATGDTGVHLHEVSGDMLIDVVKAHAGDVRLRAAASIFDGNNTDATDVFGRSITLTTDFGAVGESGRDLEIDSSFDQDGSVNISSSKNVHLIENLGAGDLRLGTVMVNAGTAFIKAAGGSILDADGNQATTNVVSNNLLSGSVWLFASKDIGHQDNYLTSETGKLEAISTTGSTYILNTGKLQVGGVTGSATGIKSGGEVAVTTKSPLIFAKHVDAEDQVTLTAGNDGGDDDYLLIEAGTKITSIKGAITLQAGDDITIGEGVLLTGDGDITITNADDAGDPDFVLIESDVTMASAKGAVTIQAGDHFTIENGAQITAFGNVLVTTADDVTNGDYILLKNGSTVTSSTGSVELRAGDDVTIEKGAFVDADTSIILRSDYNSADDEGASITVEGALQAPGMQLHGGEQADTIVLRPESLVGDTQVFGHGGDDTITLDHLPSITTTQVIAGQIVRDTIDLDGGEGGDSYTINISGTRTDYLVNLTDTGVAGNDVVTVNATADHDLFLLRANFIAYLNAMAPLTAGVQPGPLHAELERINYNSNVEHVNINTFGGDDHFYVDDNSATMTLDAGLGKDFFQFGQLFGTKREAPAVAVGDEISTLRTTLGHLSRGVSHQTTAMGGDGDDTFQVYSNQAELGLEGNDGDDTFIVRSFALADESGKALIDQSMSQKAKAMGGTGNDVVQYNVNANLDIDGGGGTDRFILLGSELSDDFVITDTNVFGGGHSVTYENVEKVTVDGLQGNDNFFILGTKAGVVTTVAGGHGWDAFHVGGDITRPIASKAFQDLMAAGNGPAGNHIAAGSIGGPLIIEGGFGPEDFSLRQAVILPTETDELLSQLVNPPDDDDAIDTLSIYDDGNSANEIATLTEDNFRTTGMAGDLDLGNGKIAKGGISYQHVETLEVMLGTGDDALTIESTMNAKVDGDRGPLTIVHGGGGSDTITVNGGGGADSPLVIFGDTEQDGARYGGTAGVISGKAWQFTNAGDDIIDATNADGAVAIFGGRGGDTITGSAFGDQLAGGSGDDTVNGLAGDDIVYGDSGFNVHETSVIIPEPNNVGGTVARTEFTRNVVVVDTPDAEAAAWADTLTAGNDDLFGGDDDDIVIGDLGVVEQVLAENLYDTSRVILVTTSSVESGGDDVIVDTPGDDLVLGGSGADEIDAGGGENVVIGDNGSVELQTPDGLRLRIESSDYAFGGIDTITTLGGNDVVLGGRDGDVIDAGDGGNIVFGDDGEIRYAADGRLDRIQSTSTTGDGGADSITTGSGDDVVIGGRSDDDVFATGGDNLVIGDSGRVLADASSTTELWNGIPLPIGTIETFQFDDGGIDVITAHHGNNTILGGAAGDVVVTGNGNNTVFGDDGRLVYAADGRLTNITSTSTDAHGGEDTITTGDGHDIVLGGRDGDTITGGAGDNVVFGDSGRLQADSLRPAVHSAAHLLPNGTIESTEHGQGGIDTIITAGAAGEQDIIIGGHDGDIITAGDGDNIVFGDDGEIIYAGDGNLARLDRTSPAEFGGADDITTGAGQDIIIGGRFGDTIDAGAGDDVVMADHATVEYVEGVAVTITTTDTHIGGDDTVHAGDDDDVVIGATGSDAIDGGAGRDLLFGDSVTLDRSATLGDFRNPRFRALTGTQIYSVAPANAGQLLIDTNAYYQDPRGPAEWADYQITLLHHDDQTAATLYGDDYIAGGADDDTIFAQLGDDVVQGDGSIDFVSNGGRVGAARPDFSTDLTLNPSFEAATDGHDYIEGGGGRDVLFGNNGQDDIIGGSSSLFSRTSPNDRPDTGDIIFGGAGTDAGRNDLGDGSLEGHAHDADTIVGDNGHIFRLVGTNGTASGGFLTFTYDTYSTERIVPRGVTLIDYTPGGPDFAGQAGPMVIGDIGAADEIHGESGDDIAYGGAGNDVLFGDAQDDDLIGGYGHDWISGGAGEDGILGDDGRIFTSRNGSTEPLNGVTTVNAQTTLIGNGPGTINSTVHVTGTLHKHVDLTPFELDPNHANPDVMFDPQYADDIIFGGLGRDFIHAGAGDDAVSGAEALAEAYIVNGSSVVRSDFNRPHNPGDVLNYNETTTLFAQYDPANPMRRILLNPDGTLSANGGVEFFLNFDPTEGPLANGSTVATDGDDLIFGDMGHDWLVGGTGRDHAFGGWGDDLINLDDDHRTNNNLNTTPDGQASYADFTYGGAGRDVMIANTAGDNMVDTNGEFNTFLVPFAKYGPPTVNRMINPQMEQFLYSLGKADGADQTLAAPGVPTGGTAARFGEPFGELAVITPQDEAAGLQHGGPRDPQAGNEGGTSVDSTTTTSTGGNKKNGSSTTSTTSSLTSSTTLAAPTTSTATAPETSTTTAPTTSTPSIDWSGSTANVTVLPWAQTTPTKPVGLSVPTFDADEDDDDLIDWAATPAVTPSTTAPQTTTTISAAPKTNGNSKK